MITMQNHTEDFWATKRWWITTDGGATVGLVDKMGKKFVARDMKGMPIGFFDSLDEATRAFERYI